MIFEYWLYSLLTIPCPVIILSRKHILSQSSVFQRDYKIMIAITDYNTEQIIIIVTLNLY